MSALSFALPASSLRLEPIREPRAAGFKVGDPVLWKKDGDEGTVTGIIPHEALGIRWDSNPGHIEWYPLWSFAIEHIETIEDDREDF
jgi:hypothetical protein